MQQFIDPNSPEIIVTLGLVGFAIAWVLNRILVFLARKSESGILKFYNRRATIAQVIFIPVLAMYLGAVHLSVETESEFLVPLRVIFILSASYYLIRLNRLLQDVILENLDLDKEDNRAERKIITQVNFIKKGLNVVIVIVAMAIILLSFEEGQKYGAGLLTSAGIASVIIGFAAQKTIANFLAGLQIAFTQPIKQDDAVVVEGEWGWIEEINLTYVVVRIWDWRRLVLPITYFVEKPFQNWTRSKAEIIGSVIFHLDYRAPIDKIREKLEEIVKGEPNWDGNVVNLQVTDTTDKTMTVRALMSAKNSPMTWDLRCAVREKMITYLQKEYPESLPLNRHLLENSN